MPHYVTIAATIEPTGAALTASELRTRLIHHADPARLEVTPTPTTN
jgi:hypothetical protein